MSAHIDRAAAVKRGVLVGVVGGALGAAAMAMYAMVVSAAVKDVGFFTPLYHIASAIIAPKAMMTSMAEAGDGNSAFFTGGPAAVGLVVHMMVGVGAGAVFGALVGWFRPGRALTVVAGAIYGLLVMVGSAFVGLPIVANLFGGGKAVSEMATMVGWGTFTVEHLIFGLVLGVVVGAKAAGPALVASRPVAARTA